MAREPLLDPRLLTMLLAHSALITSVFGAEMLLDISIAERLGWGPQGAGVLIAVSGVGGLVGSAGIRLLDAARPTHVLMVCAGVMAAVLASVVVVVDPTVVIVARFVEGAAGLIGDVVLCTLLQRHVAGGGVGAAFGRLESWSSAGQLAALGACGALVALLPLQIVILVTACLALASMLVVPGNIDSPARLMAQTGARRSGDTCR